MVSTTSFTAVAYLLCSRNWREKNPSAFSFPSHVSSKPLTLHVLWKLLDRSFKSFLGEISNAAWSSSSFGFSTQKSARKYSTENEGQWLEFLRSIAAFFSFEMNSLHSWLHLSWALWALCRTILCWWISPGGPRAGKGFVQMLHPGPCMTLPKTTWIYLYIWSSMPCVHIHVGIYIYTCTHMHVYAIRWQQDVTTEMLSNWGMNGRERMLLSRHEFNLQRSNMWMLKNDFSTR